jgi:hypothetical protein
MENKIFYMKTAGNQTTIACGFSAGDFEKHGISNHDVMKWCMGLQEHRLQTDCGTEVVFEVKELKN